jgi:hypothetical protein
VSVDRISDDAWILDLEDIEKDTAKVLQFVRKHERPFSSTKHSFSKGQVLYSKLRPYLNKVVVAPEDGYCTSEILPLSFNIEMCSEYVRLFLMSDFFLAYANQCSYGVKMPRLGTTDGKKALFALPPLQEQKRIAYTATQAIEKIEIINNEKESLLDSVTSMKSKILSLAIRGKLVPQNSDDEPASVLLNRIRAEREMLIKAGKIKRSKNDSIIIKSDDNSLLLVSLFVVVLASLLFVGAFMNGVSGASLENAVHVKNEDELKNAVDNVSNGKSATIALDNDITLSETVKISDKKDITLTSNKNSGYYKLIGPDGKCTIYVENGGVLRLDGIIVTHAKGASGVGIYVTSPSPALVMNGAPGCLFMYSGEISGNAADITPHGVWGGGVNIGVLCLFEMYGGKISGNKATSYGGGVVNNGKFTMYGGKISGNTAEYGGGVASDGAGTFIMFGGKISGNTANWGGGIYRIMGGFSNNGGVISGNIARNVGNNVCISKGDNVYVDGGDGSSLDGNSETPSGDVGSSNGNNGSSDGNNGGSGSDGGGSSNGSNNEVSVGDGGGVFVGVFSFRDVVFIGVGVAIIIVGVVVAVLFFTYKKEAEFIRKKEFSSMDS